jgi:hypothetical protein
MKMKPPKKEQVNFVIWLNFHGKGSLSLVNRLNFSSKAIEHYRVCAGLYISQTQLWAGWAGLKRRDILFFPARLLDGLLSGF